MTNLVAEKYGIGGICVLLTLMVLLKVGELLWSIQTKREQRSYAKLCKLENDLKRAFAVLKALAGDRWNELREDFTKDFPF